jgi:hypothetical protein
MLQLYPLELLSVFQLPTVAVVHRWDVPRLPRKVAVQDERHTSYQKQPIVAADAAVEEAPEVSSPFRLNGP